MNSDSKAFSMLPKTHMQLSREMVRFQHSILHWEMGRRVHKHKLVLEHTRRLLPQQTYTHTHRWPSWPHTISVPPIKQTLPSSSPLSVYPADEWSCCLEDNDDTFFPPRVPPLCLSCNYTGRNGGHTVIRWWALPRPLALSPLCEREAVRVSLCVCVSCTSIFGRTKCLHKKNTYSKVSTFFVLAVMGFLLHQHSYCFGGKVGHQ